MTAAPSGSLVRISYDSPHEVAMGDYLSTTTGRTYVVATVRRQEKGKHRGRWHLLCAVVDSVPPGTSKGGTFHPLRWYKP